MRGDGSFFASSLTKGDAYGSLQNQLVTVSSYVDLLRLRLY